MSLFDRITGDGADGSQEADRMRGIPSAETLRQRSDEDPEETIEAFDAVVEYIRTGTPAEREQALRAFANLAAVAPQRGLRVVSLLRTRMADDHQAVRAAAIAAFAPLPPTVFDPELVDAMAARLQRGSAAEQVAAARALGAMVGRTVPDDECEGVTTIQHEGRRRLAHACLDVLTAAAREWPSQRAAATVGLTAMARELPATLAQRSDLGGSLAPPLETTATRPLALLTLEAVSAVDPTVARPVVSPVTDCLDADQVWVRRSAATVLARLANQDWEAILPAVDALGARITPAADDRVARRAGTALVPVLTNAPEQVVDAVEGLSWSTIDASTTYARIAGMMASAADLDELWGPVEVDFGPTYERGAILGSFDQSG
jgi:hypothetical protein